MNRLLTHKEVLRQGLFSEYPGIKFRSNDEKCFVFGRPSDFLPQVPILVWSEGKYQLGQGTFVPNKVVVTQNNGDKKVMNADELCFLDSASFSQFLPTEVKTVPPQKINPQKPIASFEHLRDILTRLKPNDKAQFSPADNKLIPKILEELQGILYLSRGNQPPFLFVQVQSRTPTTFDDFLKDNGFRVLRVASGAPEHLNVPDEMHIYRSA